MAGTTDATNPFPEWLQEHLTRLGWTMAELARRSDTQQSVINRIMDRKVNLGSDVARRIADAINTPQLELFAVAQLIDQPLAPRNLAEAELLQLANSLTDDDRDTLIWFAKSLQQKREAERHNEKADPTLRVTGKGKKA
jgi:transcriptional regulator with XRE-family HTH domain